MAALEKSIGKMRGFYACKPGAPFFQREFGWFTLEKWQAQGYLKKPEEVGDYSAYLDEVFSFDTPCVHNLGGCGWCEAELLPRFDEVVLEDRGTHELVQDFAGREVLCFKGRRNGFMPQYVSFPVRDNSTFEKNILWRLDPDTPERAAQNEREGEAARGAAEKGMLITQQVVGGYMYLRSLLGPEALLYALYDDPELIRACMETWFALADAVTRRHQRYVSFDELFLGEDICYNHGCFISPGMMREFLLPYYRRLYENIAARQVESRKKLHFQIDTDGFCEPVIDLYRSIGVDEMSPFEAAAGCDLHRVARKYPDLLLTGGIDKRVLSADFDTIDRYLDGLLPPLIRRGGYIPTCDHGVPEETPFENYMHYRERMLGYAR